MRDRVPQEVRARKEAIYAQNTEGSFAGASQLPFHFIKRNRLLQLFSRIQNSNFP
jgi:hypothetical protein